MKRIGGNLMGKFDCDLLVLGAGAAGFVASKVARGFGKSVIMVEKGIIGGECTNFGCVPSKALIRVGKAVHELNNLDRMGLGTKAPVEVTTDGVMSHVRSIVQEVYDSHHPDNFKKLGIDILFGSPRFLDEHHIDINGKTVSAGKIIISTGSSPSVPEIKGIKEVPYLTNSNVFSIDKLPRSLLVLGGGPIGVELASAFNRLGVKVSVIEMFDTILPREDRELAGMLSAKLVSEGLNIITSAKVLSLSKRNGEIVAELDVKGERKEAVAESLLVATGRRPNLEGLDLEKCGVRHTPDGISVNEFLQTSAKNIYACGDVTGPYRFSHMSEYQAVIACRNAFLPFRKKVDYKHVVWSTFTDPELAHAGLTEEEARAKHGDGIKILRSEFGKTDKGRTDLEGFGISKIILEGSGKVIGAHILGAHATEVMHELQLARHFNIPFWKIWEAIHIYPSYSDVIRNPSKYFYGERLAGNFFVKLLGKLL